MGLMGTAGMLSILFVLPQMGKVYDHYKSTGGEVYGVANVMSCGCGASGFAADAFGAIWLYDRSRGGFRADQAYPCRNS